MKYRSAECGNEELHCKFTETLQLYAFPDRKDPQIAVDKASKRHFRVEPMFNRRRPDGLCYVDNHQLFIVYRVSGPHATTWELYVVMY